MHVISEFHLQARPDFSSFFFPVGANSKTVVYLNFIPQNDETIAVSIERHHLHEENDQLRQRDVDAFFYGVLLTLELYSSLYPDKRLLCRSDDDDQSIIFRTILGNYRDILNRVFSITVLDEKEEIESLSYSKNAFSAYTLKRLDDTPSVKADLSNYKYNMHSALFDLSVTVQMLIHFHSQLN